MKNETGSEATFDPSSGLPKPITAKEYNARARENWPVKMPWSGDIFIIRLPNVFWHLANSDGLPGGLLAKVHGGKIDPESIKTEDMRAAWTRHRAVIEDCVLAPKLRHPADEDNDEIDFFTLHQKDADFLFAYLSGQVDKNGRSLRADGRPGQAPPAGEAGADLPRPADAVAQPEPVGDPVLP